MRRAYMGLSYMYEPRDKEQAKVLASSSAMPLWGDVYVDLDRLRNPTFVIVGASGSGKTTLLNRLLQEMGQACVFHAISFHGDVAPARNLKRIKIGGDGQSVNLLDIPQGTSMDRLGSVVSSAVERMALPSLGAAQRAALETEIRVVLEQNGKSNENGFYVPTHEVGIEHVLKRLKDRIGESERPSGSEKAIVLALVRKLEQLVSSNAFEAGRFINLEELIEVGVVYDLSELSAKHQGIVSSCITRMLVQLLRRRPATRGKKLFLVVDEFQNLLNADKEVVTTVFQQMRKFGLGMIVATQDFTILRERGLGVLNNTSVLISLENATLNEARTIAREMGFFSSNINGIGFGRGSMKVAYKEGTHIMHAMNFTTHPDSLEARNQKQMIEQKTIDQFRQQQYLQWQEGVARENRHNQYLQMEQRNIAYHYPHQMQRQALPQAAYGTPSKPMVSNEEHVQSNATPVLERKMSLSKDGITCHFEEVYYESFSSVSEGGGRIIDALLGQDEEE